MISARIQSIIDAVDRCGSVADVGCDHGYIGAGILTAGKADRCIFTDISLECLNKARALCAKMNLSNCSFYCVDGITGEPDCAVIAGMGGREIMSILSRSQPQRLVLQPQKNLPKLRAYLADKYKFISERIVFDRKYYTVMTLELGTEKLFREQLIFGVNPVINDDFIEYINYRYLKLLKLQGINDSALTEEREIIENVYPHLLRASDNRF